MSSDAHQIIDRIWLGNKSAAKSKDFLDSNNITTIINCSKTIRCYFPNNFEYHRLPVNDRLHDNDVTDMSQHLGDAVNYAFDKYLNGETIFIHCHKGRQRSATVLTVLLSYLYPNKNLYEILDMIKKKRNEAFNFGKSVNFIDVMNQYVNNL